jgi:hypothetical protein
MTFAVNLSFALMSMDDLIRILAIVGGAAVGGLLTGFLTQAIVRGYTGQKVPQWVVWTLRVLGAVALGYVVYLVVYNPGNGLFGGFGGNAEGKDGGGKDGPRETRPAVTTPKDDKSTDKDKSTSAVAKTEILHIQVLGDDPLQKLVEARRIKSADPERCYRIEEDDAEALRTLKEVKDYILQRVKVKPPLKRIEVVLYKDSPQENAGPVSALKKYADDLTLPDTNEKVIVDYKRVGEAAPVR